MLRTLPRANQTRSLIRDIELQSLIVEYVEISVTILRHSTVFQGFLGYQEKL